MHLCHFYLEKVLHPTIRWVNFLVDAIGRPVSANLHGQDGYNIHAPSENQRGEDKPVVEPEARSPGNPQGETDADDRGDQYGDRREDLDQPRVPSHVCAGRHLVVRVDPW